MSAGPLDDGVDGAPDGTDARAPDETTALRIRRLELDLDDLRAENARLKGSIAQRQDEIVRLGERLAGLQARLIPVQRVAGWTRFRGRSPLGALLRRLR